MAVTIELSPTGGLLIGSPDGAFPIMPLGYDPAEAVRRVLKGQALAAISGKPFGAAEAEHWLQHHPKGTTSGLIPGCALCAPELRRASGLKAATPRYAVPVGKVIVRRIPKGTKGPVAKGNAVSNTSSMTVDQLFGTASPSKHKRK
jgi:hypothetical protein